MKDKMKYEVIFTVKRKIRVVIESDDNSITVLGEVNTTSDLKGEEDPRWKIEQRGYDAAFNHNDYIEHDGDEGENDEVIDRSIKFYNEGLADTSNKNSGLDLRVVRGSLPTDNEISQVAYDEMQQDWNDLKYQEIYKDGYIDGATWCRNKAKGK